MHYKNCYQSNLQKSVPASTIRIVRIFKIKDHIVCKFLIFIINLVHGFYFVLLCLFYLYPCVMQLKIFFNLNVLCGKNSSLLDSENNFFRVCPIFCGYKKEQ